MENENTCRYIDPSCTYTACALIKSTKKKKKKKKEIEPMRISDIIVRKRI